MNILHLHFYFSDVCDNETYPCLNNGVCEQNTSVPLGYTCTCPVMWIGNSCENSEFSCILHILSTKDIEEKTTVVNC